MAGQEYKHIVQDITNLYIGGRCTYNELMDRDDVPFKLKTIMARFMLREVDGDTTLENHFFHMEKNSMSYMLYQKMKVKLLLNVFYEDGAGKNKPGYRIDEFTMDQLIGDADIMANKDVTFLTEIRIKKISMMGVSV